MKKSSDTIGIRTHDLLACNSVPQPTGPPRAPEILLCKTILFLKICVEQVEQVINNDMTYLYCLHRKLLFQNFKCFYLEYI